MFKKLFDWICDCFARPPRPGNDYTIHCNDSPAAENPLNGLGCTEPPYVDGSFEFSPGSLYLDPPRCYGGVGPCDPMPTIFRVAFPCHVPGSTCQQEGYPSNIPGNCCQSMLCLVFPGFDNGAGCTRAVSNIQLNAVSVNEFCILVGLSDDNVYLTVATNSEPGQPDGSRTIFIQTDCSGILHVARYRNDGSDGPCAATFTRVGLNVNDTGYNSEFFPDALDIILCNGPDNPGEDTAVIQPTCAEGFELTSFTVPTGLPARKPPFDNCPSCWVINETEFGSPVGAMGVQCCSKLNGEHILCYYPLESQGNTALWGTPCLPSHDQVDEPEPCSGSGSDVNCPDAVPCGFSSTKVVFTQCDRLWDSNRVMNNSFTLVTYGGSSSCSLWYPPAYIDGGNETQHGLEVSLNYAECCLNITLILNGVVQSARTEGCIPVSDVLDGLEHHYSATFNIIGGGTESYDFSIWLQDPSVGTDLCGPRRLDARRRLWQLTYDKTLLKWQLRSLNSISVLYELDASEPCVGTAPLVLTRVDPADLESGCATSPDTITLTPGTTEQCNECATYAEPGCQVMLYRNCGEETYALRHKYKVSANPALSHICKPERGDGTQRCCNIGCDYVYSPEVPCCPVQKWPFQAIDDPWFHTVGNTPIWSLDFSADPITLTGDFIEGEVVYEVDSDGLKCDSVTHLVLSSTTLPDELARIFPSSVCMVSDKLSTCNVRKDIPGLPVGDPDFGPCYSAGYDPVTGHDDFCACNATCNPIIPGTISIGSGATCTANVCAVRTVLVPMQDTDHKTSFPYIACARFYDGAVFNVVTQIMYCVGPDNLWASDWYCTKGSPEDTLVRICAPCSVYLGDFKGTTYAAKAACNTLPFFSQPSTGMGDCVCGVCCSGVDLPSTLHVTIGSTSVTLVRSGSLLQWGSTSDVDPCGLAGFGAGMLLSCNDNVWRLTWEVSCSDPSENTVIVTGTCDPFDMSGGSMSLCSGDHVFDGTCGPVSITA